jgi:hypothetical protein
LPSESGHSWCTGQSLCHQNSTLKTLHSNQRPNHSTSEYQNLLRNRLPNQLQR